MASGMIISCIICDEEIRLGTLSDHIYKTHIGPHSKTFICSICNLSFSSNDDLYKHAMESSHLPLQVHNKMKARNLLKKWRLGFSGPKQQKRHKRSEVKEKPYVKELAEKILNDCLQEGQKLLPSLPCDSDDVSSTAPNKPMGIIRNISGKNDMACTASDKRKKKESKKHKSCYMEKNESNLLISPANDGTNVAAELVDGSSVSRRQCKKCKLLVPNQMAEFYRHVSSNHITLPLRCSFCSTLKHNACSLEKHVADVHKSELFSILNIKEKDILAEKTNECFLGKTAKTTRFSQKKRPRFSSFTTDKAKIDKTGANSAQHQLESTLAEAAVGTSVSPTLEQEQADDSMALCNECGIELLASSCAKRKHVVQHHLGGHDETVDLSKPSDQLFEYLRLCFPEDDPHHCAQCRKTVKTGTFNHVASQHVQQHLFCPFCSQHSEFLPQQITKHIREAHPNCYTGRGCFAAPDEWKDTVKKVELQCFPQRKTKRNREVSLGNGKLEHALVPVLVNVTEQSAVNVSDKLADKLSLFQNSVTEMEVETGLTQPEEFDVQAEGYSLKPVFQDSFNSNRMTTNDKDEANGFDNESAYNDDECTVLNETPNVYPSTVATTVPFGLSTTQSPAEPAANLVCSAIGSDKVTSINPLLKVPSMSPESRSSFSGNVTAANAHEDPYYWGPPSRPSLLGSHPRGYSENSVVGMKTKRCAKCKTMRVSTNLMKQHVWSCHLYLKKPPYECRRCRWQGYCEKTFSSHSSQCSEQCCNVKLNFDQCDLRRFKKEFQACFGEKYTD